MKEIDRVHQAFWNYWKQDNEQTVQDVEQMFSDVGAKSWRIENVCIISADTNDGEKLDSIWVWYRLAFEEKEFKEFCRQFSTIVPQMSVIHRVDYGSRFSQCTLASVKYFEVKDGAVILQVSFDANLNAIGR